MKEAALTSLQLLLTDYTKTWVPPDTSALRKHLGAVTPEERYDIIISTIYDGAGLNAVQIAATKNHLEILQCILDSLDSRHMYHLLTLGTSKGCTALSRAAMMGHTMAAVDMLKRVTAQEKFDLLKQQSSLGTTAVHVAARMGNSQTIKDILEKVSQQEIFELLKIKDLKGCTAIHLGVEFHHTETVQCMLDTVSLQQQTDLIDIPRKLQKSNFESQLENFNWLEQDIDRQQEDYDFKREYKRIAECIHRDIEVLTKAVGDLKIRTKNKQDKKQQMAGASSKPAMTDDRTPNSRVESSRCDIKGQNMTQGENAQQDSSVVTSKPLTDDVSEERFGDGEEFNCDEESISTDLIKEVQSLCAAYGVSRHFLLQNPQNLKNIAILGTNTKRLPDKALQALNSRFEGYNIFVPEHGGRVYTKQLTWENSLKIERFGIESNGSCELLVQAKDDRDEEALHAVGPAHIIATNEENRRLMEEDDAVSELRRMVEESPPRKVYRLRSRQAEEGAHNGREEEGEPLVVPTSHPPLLGYRYFYQGLGQANPQDADVMQSEDQVQTIEREYFLNDMILFPFDSGSAVTTQPRLQQYRPTHLVRISTLNKLITYNRPPLSNQEIRIAVRGFSGKLCNNFLTIRDQRKTGIAHHLLFTLEQGNLTSGDSGSIVYEVRQTDTHKPLGMLVGEAEQHFPNEERYYQALILDQAFRDLQAGYPNILRSIKLYTIAGGQEEREGDRDSGDEVVGED